MSRKYNIKNELYLSYYALLLVVLFVVFYISNTLFLFSQPDLIYVDIESIGGKCNDNNIASISQPLCTINKALSVVKPGQMIYLRKGNYPYLSISNLHGLLNNTISIIGEDKQKVIITSDEINPRESYISISNSSYIDISNISILNSETQLEAPIKIDNSNNIQISNTIIQNNRGGNVAAIIINESDSVQIIDNLLENNSGYGIQINKYIGAENDDSYILIDSNQILNTNFDASAGGIQLNGNKLFGVKIFGNTIGATDGSGIEINGARHNLIANNIINANDISGIIISNTDQSYNLIFGNTISSNSVNGIDINLTSYTIIINNNINNNQRYGIDDTWKSPYCNDNECGTYIFENIGYNNRNGNMAAGDWTKYSSNNIWFDDIKKTANLLYNYRQTKNLADFYLQTQKRLDDPKTSSEINPEADNFLSINPQILGVASNIPTAYNSEVQLNISNLQLAQIILNEIGE